VQNDFVLAGPNIAKCISTVLVRVDLVATKAIFIVFQL
jgi:hypothetical protein